jgi:carbohydrate-selective porin OprB
LSGIGVAVERVSRVVEKDWSFDTVPDLHAEAYLRFPLTPGVGLSPDLQWAREWGDDSRVHGVLVAGLRARVAF